MHTLQLKLNTTASDRKELEKRFRMMNKCHNVLVKHAINMLHGLERNPEYRTLKERYCTLLRKEKLSKAENAEKRALSKQMTQVRNEMGCSEYGLINYIKPWGKRNGRCLQSQPIQIEASRVWHGVERVLFGNGEQLHFKKLEDMTTIGGKSNLNGVRFDKEPMAVKYNGLIMPVKLSNNPKDRSYVKKSLDSKIKYCELKRMMFPNGWHYYVIIVMDDDAPKKLSCPENGTGGVDIGTSTVAVVTDNQAVLEELAPAVNEYNRRITKLQRSLDRSKRAANPNKYNEDGTIKKGNRDKWVYSKNYRKKRRQLRSLFRQKSAYIKQSHERLCNHLLRDTNTYYVEQMNFAGLAKRAKTTKRPNGKKKRFGKSLNNRAPASFVATLKRKCEQYGGWVHKVNTRVFKASQFHHDTGEYIRHSLSERTKTIEGYTVQRDLYSAFLLKNSDPDGLSPMIEQCNKTFESFLDLQDSLVVSMRLNGISNKACFGF